MWDLVPWVCGASGLILIGLAAGISIGRLEEREAWRTRALPKNQTPYYCDGEFYYVIPEHVFCIEYELRKEPEPEKETANAADSEVPCGGPPGPAP